jgi:NADPH:quinone reductase-like Zn-dependent oxidoreductase
VTADVGTPTAEDLAHLVGLAEEGRFRAVRDRTFDLADIAEAHRFVDTGRKRGNVVLRIAEGR